MTRPRVTLKLATSLDGRIATASGESRWITGEGAREAVHRLRAEHDAVLVGIRTVLSDDPELTVRLADHIGKPPVRVVLDSRQRLPLESRLVKGIPEGPVWVMTSEEPSEALTGAGVWVTHLEGGDRPDVGEVLGHLAEGGIEQILVEGGGEVAASFLRAGLIDRLEWFRAPIVLGAKGRPAIGGLGLDALAEAPRFRRFSAEAIGEDLWERYARA